ncbi:hypothetical protein [Methanomicrobium sp. W14]|uniref:hypothetical protein n=1 Tax=Methanomicrobium sp. W14 TaxID=2817839 RepID=UPI001AE4060C|nr:hypothetical protein [Methanomicrobium sp. W14]
MVFALSLIVFVQSAYAVEITLNSTSAEQFGEGISYTGADTLIINITENAEINTGGSFGIESDVPVKIKGTDDSTLTIIVNNSSDRLYGIKAPDVYVESGNLNIKVTGQGQNGSGSAFGIYADSGNVTVSGGSITTLEDTECHKNKGIYASHYITVTGGSINAYQHGGSNTFGLDGGDVTTNQDTDGGIIISGGYVNVVSNSASTRNYGIDSKYGTVNISGSSVIFIKEDESGSRDNFAYNENITTISGGNAVVFTSEGKNNENYILRKNAILAKSVSLLKDETFEIPKGKSLAVPENAEFTVPASTTFLFGDNTYGTLEFSGSEVNGNGATVYKGSGNSHEDEDSGSANKSPVSVAFVILALVAALVFIAKRK